MWLRAFRVNHYGAFQEREWPELQPGLNLFFGPNEAGKTTLMMFLRGMLFGFNKSAYGSLDNGEPGGSLRLLDAQGQEWTLERSGRGKKARVLVSGPQGVLSGEAGLRPLLEDVSRPVYENIFAFSLKELQDLETLKQREVQHLLYSASLGLGAVSLKAVEDRLQKQVEDLFKTGKRATNPEINQILAELAGVRRDLQELERQPQQYQEWQAEQQGLAGEIERLAQEEAAAKGQALWLDKLQQARPVWEDWRLAQEALDTLPRVDSFPEDGLGRLEKLQADLAQVGEQLDRWARELDHARAEAARPGPDPRLLQAAAALEGLAEERLRFHDRQEKLRQIEAKWSALRERLEERLTRLGPGWDEIRLWRFKPSLNWQIGIQEFQPRLEAAAAAVRQAEGECRLRLETLKEKEAAGIKAAAAGNLPAARLFPWGFAILGLALALGAGVSYFWYRDLVWPLAAGALVSAILALASFWQLRTNRSRRAQELAGEQQTAQQACKAAADRQRQAQQELALVQEEWRTWLQNASLAPDLSPAGATAFLQEIASARNLLQAIQDPGAREESEAYLEAFTARVGAVLATLGRPPALAPQVSATLLELRQELAAALKLQEQQQHLAGRIAEVEKELAGWEAKGKHLRTALDQLLIAAGEQEEEGFRRSAALFAERSELTRKTRELGARLRLLAGDDTDLEKINHELGQISPQELEEQRHQNSLNLQNLKARLEEAFQHQGRLQNLIAGLEQTDAWGRALLAEQTLAARLLDAARRWTVATLSRHYLEQARRVFEAAYQPQVLRRASQYFALLTEGRYQQVMTPLEDESFMVINRQGSHVSPERLSRGTGEQLYLALRCALIQEYSQEGRSLPLILDDILVNFDQSRARQAVRLLQEMSHSHQLLLFTCHPHILNLVQETLGASAPMPVMLEEKSDLWE
ncbi:MAG: ATP-binding protein [Desulfobaccales bacterium]